MIKSKLEDFLAYLKDKKILITTHNLVDIDGLVSCHVLKFFFNQYFEKSEIFIYFSKISKSTRNFMVKFAVKFPSFKFLYYKDIDISNVDVVLILDTNNLDQVILPNNLNVLDLDIPIVYIDHHHSNKNKYKNMNLNMNSLIFDNYSSTAEIIFELYSEFKVELKNPYNYLLISGILTDSGFFKYGNNDTITRVSKLLDQKLDIQEIFLMLNNDNSISEKIAKIKGIQRVKLIREGPWLIGVTHVGSYEASVASILIKIGFDVGIACSKKKTEYRICIRANKKICLKTGLHLGKILEELSNQWEGRGGGHEGAASFNGKGVLANILNKIKEKIIKILNN
ncbi:MAG: DHH family phosphoesterase [Promethearchaeota archaeon]